MPFFASPYFMLTAVKGLGFVICGFLMKSRPPKEINSWYGYRTPLSKKTPENWKFSQKYSSKEMIKSGFCLMALSSLACVTEWGENMSLAIGLTAVIVLSIHIIYKTENALKKLQ